MKAKKIENVTLTEFEKKVLRDAFAEGYAFDDLESSFICWGVCGKDRGGAVSSMVQKGVLDVWEDIDEGDTYVNCGDGWTKQEILELCEYYK